MRNPYEVLGIPDGASNEQINAAYKEKLRVYQNSDQNYMIDELNAAYDYLVMNAGEPSGYSSYNGYTYRNTDYSDIRAKINSGRLDDAQLLLAIFLWA